MNNKYPTLHDEHKRLERCLRELSRGRGVWRKDLVNLLRSELSDLQRHWGIKLDDDTSVVQQRVAAILNVHVQNIYPLRWNRRLTDDDSVTQYRDTALIAFNISRWPDLFRRTLQERREWQAKTGPSHLRASERTIRRLFEQAVEEIAEHLVGGVETPPVAVSVPDLDIVLDANLAHTPNNQAQGVEPTTPTSGIAAATPKVIRPIILPQSLSADLLSLSGQVRHALEVARDACQARQRYFYTFDTLLALLDIPAGLVRKCFDAASAGLADRVRNKLVTMTIPDDRKFSHFEWTERDELRLAWQYASSDGAPAIGDVHILLAIFNGTSATNRWLERFLQQDYVKVRATVERARRDGPEPINSPTPD
jgi:hypothetical protein